MKFVCYAALAVLASGGVSSIALAQVPPRLEGDRFLQPLPDLRSLPPEGSVPEQPVIPVPPPVIVVPPPPDTTVPIDVGRIDVTGSTILTADDIRPITQPLEGRQVTLQALQDATAALTQLYLSRGYITSRATLDPQTIRADGVVQIRIIEGGIERIEITGTQRLNSAYVRDRVQLGVGTPLNVARLEDQLRLLLSDPLIANVEPTLQAGTQAGQSILRVQVTEAEPFGGEVSFDNDSPPSIGSERAGVNLYYRNLTGIGDELSSYYYRTTTGGSSILGVIYRVPLNPMEGTLQLSTDLNRSRVTQEPFDDLDITGTGERYELSYRQPLIRSTREELAFSVGFTYQSGQTVISDTLTADTTTSVIQIGQDYTRRDATGGWSLRSQFNIGTGLFDATGRSDASADGEFISWLGQVQRLQRLDRNQLLVGQFDLQLTPDSLLSSEQFVIGGRRSVRGYRQNVRIGDNGLRFSIENQISLRRDASGQPMLQVAPFIDLGAVWNSGDRPNESDETVLLGAGVGLVWQPSQQLSMRLDYGLPLVDLSDRRSNLQDDGLYFTLNYRF